MPLTTSKQPTEVPRNERLEQLADEALALKQIADNAVLELDICKALIRDEVAMTPNGESVEAITESAWLRVQRSGKFKAPTTADLEPIPEDVCAQLWRTTVAVKPKPRANLAALLKQCEAAGIDTSKYLVVTETIGTVPKMGEAAEYVLDELDAGDDTQKSHAVVLRELLDRLTQQPNVIIRAIDERPAPKGE